MAVLFSFVTINILLYQGFRYDDALKMNDTDFCPDCKKAVPKGELLPHLENFHTGQRPMEEIRMQCGQCLFRVSVEKIESLISHATLTGHDPSGLKISWGDYVSIEENRLREIVRLGVRVQSFKSASKRPSETPASSPAPKRSNPDRKEGLEALNSRRKPPELKGPELRPPPAFGAFRFPPDQQQRLLDVFAASNSDSTPVPLNSPVAAEVKLEIFSDEEFAARERREKESTSALVDSMLANASFARLRGTLPPGNRPSQQFCQLCGRKIMTTSNAAVTHALSHDPNIRLFQCGNCDYRTVKKHNIRNHTFSHHAKEMGCDGSWISLATPDTSLRIRQLLRQSFPGQVWNGTFDGIDYNNLTEVPMSRSGSISVFPADRANDSLNNFPAEEDYEEEEASEGVTPENKHRICSICSDSVDTENFQETVSHVLTHDDSILHTFKCANCEFSAMKPDLITIHSSTERGREIGCSGAFVRIDQEMQRNRLVSLLKQAFSPDASILKDSKQWDQLKPFFSS